MRFQCVKCGRTAVFNDRNAAGCRDVARVAGWQIGPHYDQCPRCRTAAIRWDFAS